MAKRTTTQIVQRLDCYERLGWDAYRCGDGLHKNPYPRNGESWRSWETGFRIAEAHFGIRERTYG